jgi:isopenicillin-N epimerase
MEIELSKSFANHWQIASDLIFLNHGSFGATPTIVLKEKFRLVEQLERDPIEFLAPERTLLGKVARARETVARLVHANSDDVAFVANATDGVNAVLRSFPLADGDEILLTSHGYNACNNAVRYAAERAGASVIVADIPFPIAHSDHVISAIDSKLTNATRLIVVDHVTSSTGLVFPIEQIVQLAHHRGVRVLVDGAHAPGMLPVNLTTLDADYYTANHHKWLCGPKASGFLWVAPKHQSEVRPTVISHAANSPGLGKSQFLAEFNWTGTYDPSSLLCVPTAIAFLSDLLPGGLSELMHRNRDMVLTARSLLCDALDIPPPAPDAMIGSLATIPVPKFNSATKPELSNFQRRLRDDFNLEVPVFRLANGTPCLRVSAQAYNTESDYERLAAALTERP